MPRPRRRLARRFHEQVEMIALDREVHDARVTTLARLAEAALQLLDEWAPPQTGDLGAHAQGDVRTGSRAATGHVARDRQPAAALEDVRHRLAAHRVPFGGDGLRR
jgi:hypothetical protein